MIRKIVPGSEGTADINNWLNSLIDHHDCRPAAQVHVDQTPAAAEARVHRHMPASEVKSLLEHRYQIINLWRPINNPAFDSPLALCDYRSVDAQRDLVPVKLIYPDREGEVFGVKFTPEHRWKYLRGMNTDEVVLIKW